MAWHRAVLIRNCLHLRVDCILQALLYGRRRVLQEIQWGIVYFWVFLETEEIKLSIFFDTNSMPFLKKLICKIEQEKRKEKNHHQQVLVYLSEKLFTTTMRTSSSPPLWSSSWITWLLTVNQKWISIIHFWFRATILCCWSRTSVFLTLAEGLSDATLTLTCACV